MRVRSTSDDLALQAIAGSWVVLLGWDYPETRCDGLMGFALHRTDHAEDEAYWLRGQKTFAATDPGFPPGSTYSTREQPVQSFAWGDYTAKPGHRYTYRLLALKGPPEALEPVAESVVEVATELPGAAGNDVHFNRGVAGSQAYTRRFGDRSPAAVGPPAFDWLSRGLFEGMAGFVEACATGDELRVAAYEFRHAPFLATLRTAADRGVAVRIVYDHRDDTFPGPANAAAAEVAGLAGLCTERRSMKSAISHNKFMVRLRGGAADRVWTGGANFSEGGIFGQSNVADAIEDPDLATLYARYWDLVAADPMNRTLKPEVEALTPAPRGLPPVGNSVVFSPRPSNDLLDWYAERATAARQALFMTFAFGMHDLFKEAYRTSRAPLRFALMERASGPKRTTAEREAEEARIQALRFRKGNLFAIGGHLGSTRLEGWLKERLSGLNSHVRYIHNKFMLIDPLGDDPIVIAGSANFSEASTTQNDENMLIVRGNSRVADIYLGEFMRLYAHHAFREFAATRPEPVPELKHLRTDDWWQDHFGDNSRSRRRVFFAGT